VRPSLLILVAAAVAHGLAADGVAQTGSMHHIRLGYDEGLVSPVNRPDAKVAFELWARMVVARTRGAQRLDVIPYKGVAAMLEDIRTKQLDLVAMSPVDCLWSDKHYHLTPALAFDSGGEASDIYVLLVRRDAGISEVAELRDKSLLTLPGERGRISGLWLDVLLMRGGLPEGAAYLRAVTASPNASRAAMSVFFRQADACIATKAAFDAIGELNPQLKRQLRPLVSSPRLLSMIVCLTENADESDREGILENALNMHRSPEGRQVLALLKTEKVVAAQARDLEPLESLVKEHDQRRAQLAARSG